MTRGRLLGTAAVGLAALGVFSLAFSLLAERDLWPRLPAGALHDADLAAGFAVAIGLVVILLRRPKRTRNAEDAPSFGARLPGDSRSFNAGDSPVPSDTASAAGEAATGRALPPSLRSPE
jgi:hypothetical protein